MAGEGIPAIGMLLASSGWEKVVVDSTLRIVD